MSQGRNSDRKGSWFLCVIQAGESLSTLPAALLPRRQPFSFQPLHPNAVDVLKVRSHLESLGESRNIEHLHAFLLLRILLIFLTFSFHGDLFSLGREGDHFPWGCGRLFESHSWPCLALCSFSAWSPQSKRGVSATARSGWKPFPRPPFRVRG